jgi:hypothetical protein
MDAQGNLALLKTIDYFGACVFLPISCYGDLKFQHALRLHIMSAIAIITARSFSSLASTFRLLTYLFSVLRCKRGLVLK